jgi:integrase
MKRTKKVRRERGANWEPKVRARPDRGNWMVDLGTKFTPRKIYFATEEEATAAAAQKKDEYLQRLSGQKQVVKEKSAFNWFNLSNVQQNHLVEAYTACAGDTVKLIRAWNFHKKHTSAADASRLLEDVEKEYIAAKDASGRRARTIRDAKGKLAPFVAKLGKVSISEITTADVEGWLNDTGYSPSTRNAYRVAIVGLFNHALKRRYIEHNPATAIDSTSKVRTAPVIHSVDQVRAMMTTASNYVKEYDVVTERDDSRKFIKTEKRTVTDRDKIFKTRAMIVPYLAIGYFAGLRPENELANLDWRDIDFEGKQIHVKSSTSKTGDERYVDMSDNLVDWLAPYVKTSGKIGHPRRLLRKILEDTGVEWSKDVMRHSFGSYLLAKSEDAATTAHQMGNTEKILKKHYKKLIKKVVAEKYWLITPDQKSGIIHMPIAKQKAG